MLKYQYVIKLSSVFPNYDNWSEMKEIKYGAGLFHNIAFTNRACWYVTVEGYHLKCYSVAISKSISLLS